VKGFHVKGFHVKGFRCRPIATAGLAPGPAYESLQGKNPRVLGHAGAATIGTAAAARWSCHDVSILSAGYCLQLSVSVDSRA
jgi:hypothetical protein